MKEKLDIETVILAHKFTCPYYSPESKLIGLPMPPHCGATTVYQQKDCNGECWYISHFKSLIEELTKGASE